ncbi:MAG: DNA topoisomerase I [Candidatus Xenolissoclinum pacificiensis L6]|uniref:DNA topoisomerase 1 n=1 Tax=Candidatus Xenolissoclinum pacificiensis L6 TaxID=1401685 RepID=W2UZE4_9RICK|nr:MAG: DNA topoisomerase I [Candidatus Xenolissoclinum pacificiensis L6]
MKNLVIVESPAKAKTIGKYLGSEYQILASYGHLRGLPSKKGAVDPSNDFATQYELTEHSDKHIKNLVTALKKSDTLFLATDPDREGEAIAWHLIEAFKEKNILSSKKVVRVSFNALTKKLILESFKKPRNIDLFLVNAQRARQCLDYLVGFNISPLLWKKFFCLRSAGRVQSVALRLICEREIEIEVFQSQEYWTIEAQFNMFGHIIFKLHTYNYETLEKLSINNETTVENMVEDLKKHIYSVSAINKKELKRSPPPPFITSTLQQDAYNKLGFTVKKTMIEAQKMYEGVTIDNESIALITYIRTDGVFIVGDVVKEIRNLIKENYGKEYLSPKVIEYKSKAKNAQEAHEAIRPTNIGLIPEMIKSKVSSEVYRLYKLIWNRTIASQMSQVVFEVLSFKVASTLGAEFVTSKSHIVFDGFYRVLGIDEPDIDNTKVSDNIQINAKCLLNKISGVQHFTQPPAGYTEAKLIYNMEKLGIGRPSTYSGIINVLKERGYIKTVNKKLAPESKGRLLTAFLLKYFQKYIEYDFTANLENQLDKVANGEYEWKTLLSDFWQPFIHNISSVTDVTNTVILRSLDTKIISNQFPDQEVLCTKCKEGHMVLGVSKFGVFFGCSRYPDCKHIIGVDSLTDEYPQSLGMHTEKNTEILLNKGPYGLYIQCGNKSSALSARINVKNLNIQQLSSLVDLPRTLEIPDNDGSISKVKIGISKYGVYIQHNKSFYSWPITEYDGIVSAETVKPVLQKQIKKAKATKKQKKQK